MSRTNKTMIMKVIINALRERCLKLEEIKELVRKSAQSSKNLSQDAIRKKVRRYVDELEELGLVEIRDGRICWYIYTVEFGGFGFKLKHSRQMIPALKRIAGITLPEDILGPQENIIDDDMGILVKCAENHLRADKCVWALLEDYIEKKVEVRDQRERFCKNLKERLKEKFPEETIVEPRESSGHKRFVGSNLPQLIIYYMSYESQSVPPPYESNEEIWFGGVLVGRGKDLLNEIGAFIKSEVEDEDNRKVAKEIREKQDGVREAGNRFEEEIRKLILRIESGAPLVGGCEICTIPTTGTTTTQNQAEKAPTRSDLTD